MLQLDIYTLIRFTLIGSGSSSLDSSTRGWRRLRFEARYWMKTDNDGARSINLCVHALARERCRIVGGRIDLERAGGDARHREAAGGRDERHETFQAHGLFRSR